MSAVGPGKCNGFEATTGVTSAVPVDGGENKVTGTMIQALNHRDHDQQCPSVSHENSDNAVSPASETAADAVVGAAVRGGSLLMLLALIQRTTTFALNVLLQRAMLSATSASASDSDANESTSSSSSALEAYGAAAITLELISSTALFLAREPFRVALARSRAPNAAANAAATAAAAADTGRGGDDATAVGEVVELGRAGRRLQEAYRRRFVNTAWISAPVGLASAALVRLIYPWVIRNEAFDGIEENRQAASLVCLAAAVELVCEPLALIFQYRLLVDVRVRVEAAAVLVLGASRYLLVTRAGMGVLSFGYAQLLHSVTLAAGYACFAAKDIVKARGKAAKTTPTLARPSPQLRDVLAQAGEPLEETRAEPPEMSASRESDEYGFARARGWFPSRPTPRGDDGGRGGEDEQWVDRGKIRLAGELAGQSLLKHLLTEGDKIVLARAVSREGRTGGGGGGGGGQGGSLYEQGVYAIASGYGSLAARLLFQPLEEAARLMFSKLGEEEWEGGCPRGQNQPAPTVESAAGVAVRGRQGPEDGHRSGGGMGGGGPGGAGPRDGSVGGGRRLLRERMAALLATLLKLVMTAGLVFICFGFHYTETLLRLLLAGKGGAGDTGRSSAVSEVARVLSWYCVYVLFLAANGMCEAFACAVARGGQLTGMGAGLVASFATFWALVGPLTGTFGTRGLVMANAAGMACRVVCSAMFIRRFFLQGTGTTTTAAAASDKVRPAAGCPVPSGSRDDAKSQGRKGINDENLWREVVSGALPHPGVVAAMTVSSLAAGATSPHDVNDANSSWDVIGAARHVAVGVVCFAATALVFARCERVFLMQMGALWSARRTQPSRGGEEGDAANKKREKLD